MWSVVVVVIQFMLSVVLVAVPDYVSRWIRKSATILVVMMLALRTVRVGERMIQSLNNRAPLLLASRLQGARRHHKVLASIL